VIVPRNAATGYVSRAKIHKTAPAIAAFNKDIHYQKLQCEMLATLQTLKIAA
jgi:hypothetical protein